MAILLPTVITELEAYLVALEPILEGFRDYERLDIKAEARTIAQAGTTTYAELRTDIMAAIAALQKVTTRGYPALPAFVALPVAVDDLTANSRTIRAALGQITAEPVAAKIDFGVSEEESA